ncbi:MAG: hypothetical protein C0604_05635 [Clostridiales bacterium]|nr:MAG: hypothetical protein C0604_05635 [Clostridiales bacterium]
MQILDSMLKIAVLLLIASVACYFACLFEERRHSCKNKIIIKSRTLTESYLKLIDKKCFKLGKMRLSIGDEIKLSLVETNKTYKGKVLGIKKYKEKLCLLTDDDNIMEFSVIHIKKLKIVSRYGKII